MQSGPVRGTVERVGFGLSSGFALICREEIVYSTSPMKRERFTS